MDNGGGAPPRFQGNFFSQPSASSGSAAGPSTSSTSSFSHPLSSTPTLTYSGGSRGGPGGRGARAGFAAGGRGSAPTRGVGASKPFANKSVTFNNNSTANPSNPSTFAQEAAEENEGGGSSSFSAFHTGGSSAFAAPISSSSSSTSGYTTPVADAESSAPTSTWLNQAAAPSPAPSHAVPAGDKDGASAISEAVDVDGGDDSRKKRFARPAGSNRFLEMKAQRPLLRQKYIDQGILPDPEKPQQLSAATRFTGSCMEMCPEFEREEREFQGEGDELEVYPGTTKLDPALAVKIYRRPAAGRELPLPEDVRPPPVLKQTLDYLFHTLLPSSPNSEQLSHVQGFIWNRTRAIRQDFIVQGQAGPLTIECHERIARWHILGLHWRGGGVDKEGQPREWPSDLDPWSEQQELEQLAKTLTSLNEFYDDLRMSTGQSSPNEAEFRAYHLILNLYDPEVLRNVELLPEEVFDAPILQTAIRLRGYAQRSNRGGTSRANALNTDAPMNFFSRFFAEIRAADQRVPYLLACMLENKFAPIREGGLKALCFNYNKAHRGPSLSFVKEALGADTEEQVEEWAQLCGIEVQREGDSEPALKLNKQVELTKTLPQSFSLLVELKRGKYNSRQIIDGVASNAAPLLSNTGPTNVQSVSQARPTSLKPVSSGLGSVKPPQPASTVPAAPSSGFSFGSQAAAKSQPHTGAFAPTPALAASTTSSLGAFSSVSSPRFNAFGKAALPSKTQMKATASPFQPSQPTAQSSSFNAPFVGFKTEDAKITKDSKSLPPAGPLAAPPSSSFASPLTTQLGASKPTSSTKQTFFSSPALPTKSLDTSKTATPGSSFQLPAPITSTPAASTPTSLSALAKEPPQLALPPSETASAAAAKEDQRRKEKREKVVQRALSQLITDQATSVAKQALQKEDGRRRSQARQAFLGSISEKLLRGLQQDVIAKMARDVAANGLADEFRRRFSLRSHLARWQIRLELREERERQKARLEDVRAQVLEKGLLDQSLSASRGGLRAALMLPDLSTLSVSAAPAHRSSKILSQSRSSFEEDDQLRTSYNQSKAERSHLWEQGTFFVYIASHMASLISRWRPLEMGAWSVLLSLPDDDSASTWLKHKFGLSDEQPQKTIAIAPDVDVRGELVDGPAEVEHRDTGLLVFVLSADLAAAGQEADDEQDIWELEQERFRALEESEALSISRFSPRLLVIDWRTGSRETEVKTRLGLDASAKPFWKDVAVCNLGGASQPDELFNSAVATLLNDVSLRPRKVGPSFAETVLPLRRPWSNAAVTIEGLVARLPAELAASTSVALEIFAAMLSLANHTLEAISQASDQEYPGGDLLLPKSKLASSLQIHDSLNPAAALAQASREVIDQCEGAHEGESLYLSRALIGQAQQQVGKPFPIAALLENLLQSKLDLVGESWIARPLAEQADVREKLEEDARFVQQAAESIVVHTAEKVRVLQEQQAKVLKDLRKKELEMEMEMEVNKVIPSSGNEKKRSARSSAGSTSPFTPRKRSRSFGTSHHGTGVGVGSPAVPVFVGTPDVQRLRGLIASAKGLLAGQTV
ncbi:hypothetical protein BCV69DRAFT_283311 [Microstroma glucosiphilum]|uniref:SAC3/GANP/THP3 conserved domain-containing protein n=1 Tax=Pseudomicrostroma glucosiphilum TaxID=1684307 RepID=A0A316U5B8_9BASI|nr:hypothetical protein BCV69DRAFT_283311 [Pseudomicrostroma glucosiphilum]PWN20429.1 hypothetical protein BCV69DRAFT_283311 [Pseudomicrostroma glucosiphilum]